MGRQNSIAGGYRQAGTYGGDWPADMTVFLQVAKYAAPGGARLSDDRPVTSLLGFEKQRLNRSFRPRWRGPWNFSRYGFLGDHFANSSNYCVRAVHLNPVAAVHYNLDLAV
jgi:hypothetical protein